jgi:hypothetical protein
MDRRTSIRHELQLTCRIASGRAQTSVARTLTENVSRTGILVRWLKGTPLPKVGGRLTLDVQLPRNPETDLRVMRCRTTVVRVIPGSGPEHEVALRVHNMRFVAAKEAKTIYDLAAIPVTNNLVM